MEIVKLNENTVRTIPDNIDEDKDTLINEQEKLVHAKAVRIKVINDHFDPQIAAIDAKLRVFAKGI